MREQKGSKRILVTRDKITTKGLYPSSLELYDLMHIVTCVSAVERWQEEWSFCPVCLARYEADGNIIHNLRRDT